MIRAGAACSRPFFDHIMQCTLGILDGNNAKYVRHFVKPKISYRRRQQNDRGRGCGPPPRACCCAFCAFWRFCCQGIGATFETFCANSATGGYGQTMAMRSEPILSHLIRNDCNSCHCPAIVARSHLSQCYFVLPLTDF